VKRLGAKRFYRSALTYVRKHHPDELQWVKDVAPETFEDIDVQGFLGEYCWVVYAAGFRISVLQQKFDGLERAFYGFDLEKLYKMRSIKLALAVINHRPKAESFLKGAKQIYREGFSNFKARLRSNGMETLQELPYIGKITQKHLARNIGLVDVSKDDIWLKRLAKEFNAPSVEALTSFLANEFRTTEGVVDLVLWRYCADGGYKQLKAGAR
jgi:3-methyladenine DNA glycosylase Tag